MIHIVAILTAKPGQRAALLTRFKAALPAVLAEDGCLEYAPVIDLESSAAKYGEDSFVVIEKWESNDALKAHAGAPHMAAYAAKTREMIASRVIHILSPA